MKNRDTRRSWQPKHWHRAKLQVEVNEEKSRKVDLQQSSKVPLLFSLLNEGSLVGVRPRRNVTLINDWLCAYEVVGSSSHLSSTTTESRVWVFRKHLVSEQHKGPDRMCRMNGLQFGNPVRFLERS